MKKLPFLIILGILSTLSCLSAFGDGYFLFSGPGKGVWDGWSTGVPHLAATNNVAFLWGPTSSVPLVDSIMTATPTNGNEVDLAAAWNDILTDPNFQLALNSNSNALAMVRCSAIGSWGYNGAAEFPVMGTAPGDYEVFVIGWPSLYATPQDAAAAGAAVGWSAPFTYTAADPPPGTPPFSFASSGFVPFGVNVPEPSAWLLAGLGTAGLLSFRRRK